MRIDLLLKSLCLVKTRNQGRKGCEAGYIKLNGTATKPGRSVRVGDILEIRYPHRFLVVEIIDIPVRQVAKKDRDRYIRVIRESPLRGGDGEWDV
ncbi:MAG: RNA-binding S4 domain-containing protein [bacterium]|nr:MAG: RNA-binding S4 domain-containing protein [bacterium]